jgi:diaminopimelate decarboxylase
MNSTNQPEVQNEKYYPDFARHRNAIRAILAQTSTPLFLGERAIFLARLRDLQDSLRTRWGPAQVAYSFKTNYQVAQSRVFADSQIWAEVVSGFEYRMARELGFEGRSIIFNGPHKSSDDLRTAARDGALINVNDHDELSRLIAVSAERTEPLGIGLRLGSTLPKLGHSRFGFSLENDEATEAVSRIRAATGLRIVALHSHLYGDSDNPELYRLAAQRLGEFAQRCIPDYQRALRYVDLGGGFPAHGTKPKSRSEWNPQPIDVYVHTIASSLLQFFGSADARPTLILEPGRYLTCDGIVLVSKVLHVKERGGRQVVNCDASISMVPLTHYAPQIIAAYSAALDERRGNPVPTVIHGSTCRENDTLFEGLFPPTRVGDYLVHFAAGAYNSSLSPRFIFENPRLILF